MLRVTGVAGEYHDEYLIAHTEIVSSATVLFATCGTSPFGKERAEDYRDAHAILGEGRVMNRISGATLFGAFCICHVAHCIAYGDHARASRGGIEWARRTETDLRSLMDKMQLAALTNGVIARRMGAIPWLPVLASLRSWFATALNEEDVSVFMAGESDRMQNSEFVKVCQSIDFVRGWLADQDEPLTSGVEDA